MNNNKLKIKDGKVNFCCRMNNCQHTCCGPFAGISNELTSVDERPFDEIVLTQEDYSDLQGHGYGHLVEKGVSAINGKEYYKMALAEDGTCKAFKDGKCSIHEHSPTLCKAFPFYFDMFAGLCAIDCDGFSDDVCVDISTIQPMIDRAKKMYQFWIEFYSD